MESSLTSALTMLDRLMSAAGWHCNQNRLFEAVPHMSDHLSPDDLIKTLKNLKVPLSVGRCALSQVCSKDCPALFVTADGLATALFDVKGSKILTCKLDEKEPSWNAPSKQTGHLIRLERFDSSTEVQETPGFSQLIFEFGGFFPWLIFASFMSNLAGLALPLLIMVIYDRVIPSGSVDLVFSLAAAAALALAADCGFRFARTNAVAYMGRRTEYRMGLSLFRKLLALPIDQIQKSDVEQQLARFRQFESLRDVFSGQVLTTLLDLPFIVIFLAVLFILAPPVAWLVIGLTLIFAIAIWVSLPKQKRLNALAAKHKTALKSHAFEVTEKQREIQRLGLIQRWEDKNSLLAKQSSIAARRAGNFNLVSQFFGQSLMAIAGVSAVAISAMGAIHGDMSFGALIAVMALVWKVLTPLQALYANAPQILSFLSGKRQSDRVLALPEESVRGVAQSHQKEFKGHITVSGVTHRYEVTATPVLSQVSLEIQANEFALICGDGNSGKTSLFDLICAFRQPSIGSIQLDNIDVRQIAVDDLRRSITYEQSKPELFYGTIYQNFRLASPRLNEQDVLSALDAMGLMEEVEKFPEGIHTRLSETFRDGLPTATLRALSLARSLSREGPVLVLNDPTSGLDNPRKEALAKELARQKGTRTIIVATHEENLIELGDRFVFLDHGRVVTNDTGSAGRKKLATLKNRIVES